MFPHAMLMEAFARSLVGFLLGALAGSFLATIMIRWPEGRSVLNGRSQCDSCNARLRPMELVPLFSFLVLRGRCRRCFSTIDSRHFAVELAAAVITALVMTFAPSWTGAVTALLGLWLLLVGALDAEHQWLPDALTLPLLALGLSTAAFGIGPPLSDRIIGAVVGFIGLSAVRFSYLGVRGREGMGGGDPKLFAALGAWLGWQQLPLLLLFAGVLGLISLLVPRSTEGRARGEGKLPFGTFLALAAWPLWLFSL